MEDITCPRCSSKLHSKFWNSIIGNYNECLSCKLTYHDDKSKVQTIESLHERLTKLEKGFIDLKDIMTEINMTLGSLGSANKEG
jgi:hypothetical protein